MFTKTTQITAVLLAATAIQTNAAAPAYASGAKHRQFVNSKPYQARLAGCNYGRGAVRVRACTWLIRQATLRNFGKLTVALFHIERGRGYMQLKQTRLAISDFSRTLRIAQALRKGYFFKATHLRRGNAYYGLGQYRRALADYKAALRIPRQTRSYSHYAHHRSGQVYLKLRQNRRALAEFTSALRYNSRYANSYYFRAFAYERLGNRAAAIRDYRAGQRLAPKDAGFTRALKRLTGRRSSSTTPVRAGGTTANLKRQHARACGRGKPRAQIRSCSWLLSKGAYMRKSDVIYFNRAYGYYHLKQYRQAIRGFTMVIAINSRFGKAYRYRGHANLSMGQSRLAVQDYQRALRINPRDAVAYYNMGIAYKRLGNRAAAIRAFRAGHRITPKDPDFAKALRRLGVTP